MHPQTCFSVAWLSIVRFALIDVGLRANFLVKTEPQFEDTHQLVREKELKVTQSRAARPRRGHSAGFLRQGELCQKQCNGKLL